jgi:hypothetical protein
MKNLIYGIMGIGLMILSWPVALAVVVIVLVAVVLRGFWRWLLGLDT